MRILLIKNFFIDNGFGGAEILCHNIAASLTAAGHELFILAAGPASRSDHFNIAVRLKRIKPAAHAAQLTTLEKKIVWALCSLYNYHVARRYIENIKPDAIYLHNLEWVTSSPLSAAVDSGIKVIIHLHNHYYHTLWENSRNGSGMSGIKRLFHLSPRFGSARLIAISPSIAQEFRDSGYAPEKIFTIYNGLPPEVFRPFFPDAERKNILFVGEIEPHKGVHVAINALGLLMKQGMLCSIDIIGPSRNNPYRETLETIIADRALAGRVWFTGALPREEVWKRMRNAEVLLLPALWEEPFGLVAAEAMACGAYVIASNRGALPEVLGECGSLVEPTPDGCAEEVRNYFALSSQEKEALRHNAYNRAETLFCLDKNIALIERVLRS